MTALRRAMGIVTGVATFYFVGWMGTALLSIVLPYPVAAVVGFAGAVASGVQAGRRIWRGFSDDDSAEGPGLLGYAVTGALLVGGIGFVGGFFGPMLLAPDANQGPLLGLFITGPAGAVIGAVGGFVYALYQRR